ncbi:MAG: hypothetical protein J1G38_02980 [Clostridiales bacterium]|nr:hypothetical protein [Clostridiales bacterium]
MNKKFVPITLAVACAFSSAFALAACGGDDEEKFHSEAQWKAAFDAELGSKDYRLTQDYYYEDEDSSGYRTFETVYYDGNNEIYRIDRNNGVESASSVVYVKHNSRYYTVPDGTFGEPVQKTQFDSFVQTMDSEYDSLVNLLLDQYRGSYNKFQILGSGSTSDNTGTVNYHNYYLKNSKFTVHGTVSDGEGGIKEEDIVYSVEYVTVKIRDDTDNIYQVLLEGITSKYTEGKLFFTYNPGSDAESTVEYVQYPEVYGQTYEFFNIDIDYSAIPEEKREAVTTIDGAITDACRDKRISCDANGKLDTDLVIDGTDLSKFKITDDNGQLTITDGEVSFAGVCRIDSDMGMVVVEFSNPVYVAGAGDYYPFKFIFRLIPHEYLD